MLTPIKDNIPYSLRHIPQWVCWLAVPRDNGKISKIPVSAAPNCPGVPASVDKRATWTNFETAWAYYERNQGRRLRIANKTGTLSGVGIVLTRELGLLGVDLDNAIEGGQMKPWAHDLVTKARTYAEHSPSGRGIRMFTKGTLPWDGKRTGDIEIYTAGRFLTLTGHRLVQGLSDVG